jgi:predicted DsbA family dithiol-disulfide isomerase
MILPPRAVAPRVKLEIWSDVVCPWCYIGKRRIEAALAEFDQGEDVEVIWRSFELDSLAPAVRHGAYVDHLASKYHVAVADAQAMIDRMTETAAGEGLGLRFDIARPGNTLDAHRLLHLSAVHGKQEQMKERLLAATFTEGQAIGEREVLVRLADEVGLDGDEVASMLASERYTGEVREDERLARELGITAVPFFVVDRTAAVSGAQPPEVLHDLLRRARAGGGPEPTQ